MSITLIDIQWMSASIEEAKRVGKMLLEADLVACVNIIPKVVSLFTWEGKIQEEQEVLVQCKTAETLREKVFEAIAREASYDIPAIYGFTLPYVTPSYKQWVEQEVLTD